MIINELNENIGSILTHSEIREIKSKSDLMLNPEEWRSTGFGGLESHKQFVLKNKAAHYFFNVKNILRQYCSEKNFNLSDNYLDNTIVQFLITCKESNAKKNDLMFHVKEWLQDLDEVKIHDYRILLPINHYDFKEELNLENVHIVKLTDEIIEQYFKSDKNVLKDLFDREHLEQSNHTNIYAIIDVKAHEQDAAIELANELLDKFIFAVKLFDPGSFISSRKNSYEQVNESIISYDKSKKSMSYSGHSHYVPGRITPDKDFYKKLEVKWKKLTSFLYSEHLTMFQKSILASTYWYGKIDELRDSNVKKFLYYLIGLEKLLLKKNEQKKTKKFGDHSAILFSGNIKYTESYQKYYTKRNDIVHDENIRIYDEEVVTLQINLRSLLLDMIENFDKYQDVESYYKQKYNIVL